MVISGTFQTISDEITCTFDGIQVKLLFFSGEEALCTSPKLNRTGRVPVKVLQNGLVQYGFFYSCK